MMMRMMMMMVMMLLMMRMRMVPRKLMVMMLMMRMEVDDAADTKMLLLLLLFILLTMMVMMLQKLTMMVLMLMMMMTMMMMMLMLMMKMMMMMMDVMMMNVLLGKWRVEETCMQADSLQLQVLARAHPSAEMNLGAPLPPLGARVLCDDRLMIVYSSDWTDVSRCPAATWAALASRSAMQTIPLHLHMNCGISTFWVKGFALGCVGWITAMWVVTSIDVVCCWLS